MERFLVASLGLLCCLLALEAALRLLNLFERQRDEAPSRDSGATVVLCLGDSYTDNCGLPAPHAYPPQLEDLLHRSDPGHRYQVVNLGRSGQNSATLLESLEGQLHRYRPDIVLVLTGSANHFDLTGYQAFLQADSGFGRWRERLDNLRVVKLARLLWQGSASNPASPVVRQDDPGPSRQALSRRVRDGFQALGRGSYDSAERLFRQALLLNERDAEAWNGLAQVCSWTGRYEEGIPAAQESIRLDPARVRAYATLARLQAQKGHRQQALESLLTGLERGSDQREGPWEKRALLDYLFQQAETQELAWVAERLRALIASRPYLHVYLASLDPGSTEEFRISDWVAHDLEKIVVTCRSRGVPVILMNYPNSRFIGAAWSVHEKVAHKLSVPFVDNFQAFQGLPVEPFFQPDGHCNVRGNQRVAANACTAILEVLGRSRN